MRGHWALIAAAAALAVSVVTQASVLAPQEVRDDLISDDGFPSTLQAYHFFRDDAAREPNWGVHHYSLNTPLWSDGAEKLRYIYVPGDETGAAIPLGDDGEGLLKFPVGSAIIKTFAFGEGRDQRFIETRVLLHRADGWVALPYKWNEEQTEARLVLAGGRVPITTPSGDQISYRIPNKNQCKACHSVDGEVIPIGPKARNLSADWLQSMHDRGWLDYVPEGSDIIPVWGDSSASNEMRARAYLDVNCAHCHRPGGGASNSGLDLRWEQADPFAYGVRKHPVAAGRGAGGLLVSIEPGDPDASILVHRMNSSEPGVAMPELGRSTIDHGAVAVMRDWIAGMDQ